MHGLLLAETKHYRIDRDENLFFVCFYGFWDENVATEFASTFRWLIELSGWSVWGALADLREFDGASPEAMVIGRQTLDWMIDHGQVAGGHVINSGVTSKGLLQLQELQRERIAFDTFLSYEIAVPWLQAKLRHSNRNH